MTAFRKAMGLAGVAACLSLGGCAGLMPQIGIGTPMAVCMSGYSPAAPWHMDRSGGVFVARKQMVMNQSRFMLGSTPPSMGLAHSRSLAAGECR
jgi:hypothetical protein